MKRKLLLALCLAGQSALSPAAAPNLQAGLWEITTKSEMPGMPMQMPAQTIRHCYRQQDIKEPKDTLPADKNCKIEELTQSGNTVRWKMSCNMDGSTMRGNGEVTHAGNAYSGVVNLSGNMQGQKMSMTQKYSARRVGDCK